MKRAAVSAVFLTAFFVFITAVYPVFRNNDSPETSSAIYTLGIQHPPGYPLYTIAGKITDLVPAGNPGFRANVFSALICAAAAAVLSAALIAALPQAGWPGIFAAMISAFFFAFSMTTLNISPDSKGGIYGLNVLFLAINLLLSAEIMRKASKPGLYMLVFVSALSMANHWPSALVTMPVFAAVFVLNIRVLGRNGLMLSLLLAAAGLSPYLFLPIRAASGALMNHANPFSWDNFWWLVLRRGYTNPDLFANYSVSLKAMKNYVFVLATAFSYAVFFAIPGAIRMFTRDRKMFLAVLSVIALSSIAAVFYNPRQYSLTGESTVWFVKIFLVPAVLGLSYFMFYGTAFVFEIVRNRFLRWTVAVLFTALLVTVSAFNYSGNAQSGNYLSYDLGMNMLKSAGNGSVIIGIGDTRVMPLIYLKETEHRRPDITVVSATVLSFEWAIREFESRYGRIGLVKHNPVQATKNIAEYFYGKKPVFFAFGSDTAAKIKFDRGTRQKGILLTYGDTAPAYRPADFALYSYRNIFPAKILDSEDAYIPLWYGYCMQVQADELMKARVYGDAAYLYLKYLMFPGVEISDKVFYKLSLCYTELGDNVKALKYLAEGAKLKQQQAGGVK